MPMRDLVNGGATCAVPGSSSSSNPLGALANALIGTSSKTQDRLREIPSASTPTPESNLYAGVEDPFAALPGLEREHSLQPNVQGSEFLQGFRAMNENRFGDVWNEIQGPQQLYQGRGDPTAFPLERPHLRQDFDGPPQQVLSNVLHSFLHSNHGGIPLRPASLPPLGLSEGDKRCIRDRSSIMARHIFADKSEDFVHAQVGTLLSSLDIDADSQAKGLRPGTYPKLEEYWNESQGTRNKPPHIADGWATEFSANQLTRDDPNSWVQSFEPQHGATANGWASEFDQEQLQNASLSGGSNVSHLAAMEQSRRLAHTLAQNNDPKFQNSKFLQFVSKMSRGEMIIEDNQIKAAAPGDWATEYEQQHSGRQSWADQFVKEQLSQGPHGWANEFTPKHGAAEDEWVHEFSKLNVNDWTEEFEQQIAEGKIGDTATDIGDTATDIGDTATDSWANSYDDYLNEQTALEQKSRGLYEFSDLNPYVGHPNPLKEGRELFRKGLLSEAVLALEAEVLKSPENAEGWRLLGVTHAENDDDIQAISAMMRAHEADPTNLEVLLALGVSHTNELEKAAALKYLYSWLRHHPKYGNVTPADRPENLHTSDVIRFFDDATKISPDDADVHIVLGVLFNLSREYGKAIEAFQTALKLKPQDYSLWNKLGATQANSVLSADAILSYQQALDLKPNYVRAWANMGISYANQDMLEDSMRYYVRALTMNPKAENAWYYLRTSLRAASRKDMIEACDSRNLELLQKEFPL